MDLYTYMQESATYLRAQGVGNVDIGIIAGSGLSEIHNILDTPLVIPYADIPHLPVSGAPGHAGVLRYGKVGNADILIFCGRLHYYEGYPLWQVAYPVRILQALTAPCALVTAAVGGLNTDFEAGELMLVTDHLNLMPDNPLRGLDDPRLGERFPDLTTAYDPELRQILLDAAQHSDVLLRTGVYAGLQGPSLETQAECFFLRQAGADVVGMSVVPEVITGVQAGIRMASVCIVANMAWHPGEETKSVVSEILKTADSAVPRLSAIVKHWCRKY
jgi:purine-nucleoside phosphorylase